MRRMFDEKEIKELGAEGAVAEIAKGNVENAKPIYWHTIRFQRGGTAVTSTIARACGYLIILNNSATPIDIDTFLDIIKTPGFSCVCINGLYSTTGGADMSGDFYKILRVISSAQDGFFALIYRDSDNAEVQSNNLSALAHTFPVFEDNVNKIN